MSCLRYLRFWTSFWTESWMNSRCWSWEPHLLLCHYLMPGSNTPGQRAPKSYEFLSSCWNRLHSVSTSSLKWSIYYFCLDVPRRLSVGFRPSVDWSGHSISLIIDSALSETCDCCMVFAFPSNYWCCSAAPTAFEEPRCSECHLLSILEFRKPIIW